MDKYYHSDEDDTYIHVNNEDDTHLQNKQLDEQIDDFLNKSRTLWDRVMKSYLKTCNITQPLAFLDYSTYGTSAYKFIEFIKEHNKSVKNIFSGEYIGLHD